MRLLAPTIRTDAELAEALRIAEVEREERFLVAEGAFIAVEVGRIVALATVLRLLVLSPSRTVPKVGGLLSYEPNQPAQFHRIATRVAGS
jgi:repressor of nif and glnA expression